MAKASLSTGRGLRTWKEENSMKIYERGKPKKHRQPGKIISREERAEQMSGKRITALNRES